MIAPGQHREHAIEAGCGRAGTVYDSEHVIQRRAGVLAETGDEEGYAGAAARLDRALTRLEASVRTLNGRVRVHARIELDTQKLVNERARLATDLDRANARAKRLDDSAGEVSRRLIDAMETVRQVLAR
jgi:hypothetical protein